MKLSRYGVDCYAYAMMASGQVELVIETGLKPYDIVGLIPIIEGAGGVVTDLGVVARRWMEARSLLPRMPIYTRRLSPSSGGRDLTLQMGRHRWPWSWRARLAWLRR